MVMILQFGYWVVHLGVSIYVCGWINSTKIEILVDKTQFIKTTDNRIKNKKNTKKENKTKN